jgi:hypothetical protein
LVEWSWTVFSSIASIAPSYFSNLIVLLDFEMIFMTVYEIESLTRHYSHHRI